MRTCCWPPLYFKTYFHFSALQAHRYDSNKDKVKCGKQHTIVHDEAKELLVFILACTHSL
jgi:hypothetical protein